MKFSKSMFFALFLVSLLVLTFACSKYAVTAGDTEESRDASILPASPVALAEKAQGGDGTGNAATDRPPEKNLAVKGRKLIREGRLGLEIKDIEESRKRLEKMAADAGGFVSSMNFNNLQTRKKLELTLRIPTDGFLPFVDSIRTLGYVTDESFNVIDVTDQYADLDRRALTNEKIMARLEDMLKERGYQFKDLLEVQKELARLQSETEQLKGSLAGLDERIALSTLTVVLTQRTEQQVVPPDSAFAPLVNAIENIGPQFRRSIHAVMAFAGGLINLAIWLLPWAIPAAIVFWLLRRVVRKRRAKKAQ